MSAIKYVRGVFWWNVFLRKMKQDSFMTLSIINIWAWQSFNRQFLRKKLVSDKLNATFLKQVKDIVNI